MAYLFIVIGAALIGYAVYGIFAQPSSEKSASRRIQPEPGPSLTEQRMQMLQAQITSLEEELQKSRLDVDSAKKQIETGQAKELQLQQELTRRQEWVAKSEEALNKVRQESLDLKNQFITKEKESETTFAKNVELTKSARESNETLSALEAEVKDKSGKIEAQKHQIEKLLQEIKGLSEEVSGYKKKETMSEWVPKAEFNKLNEEYAELEKQLEEKEGRLISFAQEIIQLKNQLGALPK